MSPFSIRLTKPSTGKSGPVGRDPVVERSDLVQLVDVLVTLFFGDRVDAGLGVRSPWS